MKTYNHLACFRLSKSPGEAHFIRLRRRPRIYAGRNANVIRFGVMSPFTPVNDHAVLSRRSSRAKTEAFGARLRPAPKAMADGVRSSLLRRMERRVMSWEPGVYPRGSIKGRGSTAWSAAFLITSVDPYFPLTKLMGIMLSSAHPEIGDFRMGRSAVSVQHSAKR